MKINYLLAIVVLLISSCTYNDSPKPATRPDVYVVGSLNDVTTIWKNGVPTPINDLVFGAKIVLSGEDVYVAGASSLLRSSENIPVPAFSKNGTVTLLSDSSMDMNSYANDIAISGTDVHICATERLTNNVFVARYWKNGVGVNLGDSANSNFATAIYVSGTDVYVTGLVEKNDTIYMPVYWKNGVQTNLGENSQMAGVFGITIYNRDIYLVGTVSIMFLSIGRMG